MNDPMTRTLLMASVADVACAPSPRADSSAAAAATVTFEQTYEAHFDYVWRAARHLGVDEADIEDVLQDVFVVVLRRLPTFEGRSSLRTWIYGILLREVRDRRRSGRRLSRRHERADERLDAIPDLDGATPHDSAAKTEAVALLSQLLDTLEPERRDVFVMVEVEQLTVPEIANLLGEKINTVYTRLRLARADFEAALDRHRARDEWRSR